jgi:hypothetical protein
MQRFSLDRRRFAGHPRRGFPHPSGGSPSPSKSPPKGGDRTPKGRGRAAPLSGRWPPLRPPWGTPTGFPRPFWPAPPPVSVRQWRGMGKRSAQGVSPEKGLEKNQSGGADCGRQAASGGNVGKARKSVGRGGGSRWAALGLSTGCPCLCPRTGVAARRSRSDLHISTAGGPTRPPLGACCQV